MLESPSEIIAREGGFAWRELGFTTKPSKSSENYSGRYLAKAKPQPPRSRSAVKRTASEALPISTQWGMKGRSGNRAMR